MSGTKIKLSRGAYFFVVSLMLSVGFIIGACSAGMSWRDKVKETGCAISYGR